ncbi:hypothetical protein ACQFN5_29550 (plasmid) [Klebsiella sp. WOUb02]|uniref:hypothetical protein n=1 Tax=Klebsiella sp. WOUb02 TaxID=3161071 RepID=UPI003CF26B6F
MSDISDDESLRNDLASSEEGLGASLVAYRAITSYLALSRLRTLSDKGVSTDYLGRNVDADAAVWNERLDDNGLLLPGSLCIGNNSRGIRRNAVGLSVMMNKGTGGFSPEVSGVSNSRGLRGYTNSGIDTVGTYMDVSSSSYESWEDVDSATYTKNSCVPGAIDTWNNIMVGDVIFTKHDTVCIGIVTGKNTDGSISVDEWADSSTTTVEPTDSVGFIVNKKSKLWTQNNNLFFPVDGPASKGVIQENGVRNNKVEDSDEINGVDNVVLGGNYDCTAAFLSRGSNSKGWKIGFMAQGSKNVNFYSYAGVYAPKADFYAASAAATGLRFRGNNTFASIEWMGVGDLTDHQESNTIARIGPSGYIEKWPLRLLVLSASATISASRPNLIINAEEITITLPTVNNIKTGHHIKLFIASTGNIYLTSQDGVKVNGYNTYTITSDARNVREIVFDGTSWQVF